MKCPRGRDLGRFLTLSVEFRQGRSTGTQAENVKQMTHFELVCQAMFQESLSYSPALREDHDHQQQGKLHEINGSPPSDHTMYAECASPWPPFLHLGYH